MMHPIHFYELVLTKTRLNLVSEASKSYLNYVWWILEPTLYVSVFYVVFGILLGRGGPDFVAFLVCGKIPFLWYSRSVSNSSGSILSGRSLIAQVYVPKIFFPLVVMLQDLTKQFFVFLLLLAFLLLQGVDVTSSWLYLPLVILVQIVFVAASGLVAACIVPWIPDFRFVISTGLMLLMFASGIFYSYKDFVDPRHQDIFLNNPMAALINSYRSVLLDHSPPDFSRLTAISVLSVCVILFTAWLLGKYGSHYSRLAMR